MNKRRPLASCGNICIFARLASGQNLHNYFQLFVAVGVLVSILLVARLVIDNCRRYKRNQMSFWCVCVLIYGQSKQLCLLAPFSLLCSTRAHRPSACTCSCPLSGRLSCTSFKPSDRTTICTIIACVNNTCRAHKGTRHNWPVATRIVSNCAPRHK